MVLRLVMILRLVNIGGMTRECTLDGGEVLCFFVLDFRGVDWNAVDWCWGISVDWSLVVMVKSSGGFSVSGEVSVFSSNDLWSLRDGQWSAMVTVSWESPVWDDWSVDGVDNWSGVVSSWSMWQVSSWDDLESVVWVCDVLDWLNVAVSIDIRVSSVECSVMWFGFLLAAQRIAVRNMNVFRKFWQVINFVCLPVAIAITTMSILRLELGGNCTVRNGCAWSDEQCCNYLCLVNIKRERGREKIELTSATT